jgi:hypothetical protein
MSVILTTPSVLVDASTVARRIPGGRAALRALLAAHPAVLTVAHDRRLEVAYLAPSHEADVHELIAEIAAACGVPAEELGCVPVVNLNELGDRGWLFMDNWEESHDALIAWHAASARTGPARIRAVRDTVALPPGAVRPITLLSRTFDALGFRSTHTIDGVRVTRVVMPTLALGLHVAEAYDARALHYSATFPVAPLDWAMPEYDLAVLRIRARMPMVSFGLVGDFHHVVMHWRLECDPYTTTQDWVTGATHTFLDTAHALGVPLARIALGDARAEAVDAALEEVGAGA